MAAIALVFVINHIYGLRVFRDPLYIRIVMVGRQLFFA